MKNLTRCDNCKSVSDDQREIRIVGGMIEVILPPYPLPQGGNLLTDRERQFDFCSHICLIAWSQKRVEA